MLGQAIISKSSQIVTAAGLVIAMTFALVPAARADSVGFGITLGDGPGYGDDWRWRHHYAPPPHAWGDYGDDEDDDTPPPPPRYGMSCGEAANVARDAGFRGIQSDDCSPPVYEFEGWKHGRLYSIDISRNGRILNVDPVY